MYLDKLVSFLREEVDRYEYVDVGVGAESVYCVSRERFNYALKRLQEQGYFLTTIELDSTEPFGCYAKILSKLPIPQPVIDAHREEWATRRKSIVNCQMTCMTYRNVVRYHLDDFDPCFYKNEHLRIDGFDSWRELGHCSRLLKCMMRRGAADEEIIDIVKYSMVVLDTKKHQLDWMRAAEDFKVGLMTEKYMPKKPAAKT